MKTENDGFYNFMFDRTSNEIGKGVPCSDSALSRAMMTAEQPGLVALKKGEGLYVASAPPPAQVPSRFASRPLAHLFPSPISVHLCQL